jgi:hypothetical protein
MPMRWTSGLLVPVVCAVLATAGPVSAQGDPALERLTALGGALQAAPVLSAPYIQVFVPAGMSLGDEERGVVWVSWPDRALFAMGDPVVREMGLDGRDVRLLDAEAGTCDDHHLTEEEWQRVPLVALLEPTAAVDRFTVIALEDGGIALVPRDAGGVARIEVALDDASRPVRLVIEDPQGGTNTFEFGTWRETSPPARGWRPEPPEGTTCQTVEAG